MRTPFCLSVRVSSLITFEPGTSIILKMQYGGRVVKDVLATLL